MVNRQRPAIDRPQWLLSRCILEVPRGILSHCAPPLGTGSQLAAPTKSGHGTGHCPTANATDGVCAVAMCVAQMRSQSPAFLSLFHLFRTAISCFCMSFSYVLLPHPLFCILIMSPDHQQ